MNCDKIGTRRATFEDDEREVAENLAKMKLQAPRVTEINGKCEYTGTGKIRYENCPK
jgi:hypothetical protein